MSLRLEEEREVPPHYHNMIQTDEDIRDRNNVTMAFCDENGANSSVSEFHLLEGQSTLLVHPSPRQRNPRIKDVTELQQPIESRLEI